MPNIDWCMPLSCGARRLRLLQRLLRAEGLGAALLALGARLEVVAPGAASGARRLRLARLCPAT